MTKAISLPKDPIEKDYEEYICAFFQGGGFYIEKSIIYREVEEILELDIIINNFQKNDETKQLIEIKSGGWGFSDIFKVKGWMTYLKIDSGLFIIHKENNSIQYFQEKALELDVELINNADLTKTSDCLKHILIQIPQEEEIETIRFSYLLERKLLKELKQLKKKNPENQGYKNMDDYFFKVNSSSFFSSNPVNRIKQLFETYIKYKNLTAKVCYELEKGEYDDTIEQLSSKGFSSLFYQAENSPLQIALYIEHIARITILKTCIEQLLQEHKDSFELDNFIDELDYLSLPNTIKEGLGEIVKDPYFYRYPVFWQFFTYVMGGFILTDFKDQEYEYLSKNTGIPVEEIPNAFNSFNKLYPREDGWFFTMPHSSIEWHRFFPITFSGIGANHRRYLHLQDLEEEQRTYEELGKRVTGSKTNADLVKWNNLTYYILQ